ncbi:MAG: energy transducer TonB [Stygiobacter sp.]
MKTLISFRTIYMLLLIASILFLTISETKGNNIYPGDEAYAIAVEKAPAPIGGLEAIVKKITYPDMAIKTRTEGKVYVLVFINENGEVDDVKVVKGIGAGCDEETVRAVKKTKFSPGVDKGVNVKTKLAIAIQFKIPS